MGRQKKRSKKVKIDSWEKLGSAGAYKGIQTTSKVKDISYKKAKEFLSRKDGWSLHVTPRRKFPRRRSVASGINSLWQIDLADMSRYADSNNGVRYILIAIDVVSRFLYARPMLTKSAESTIKALESIFQEARPKKIFSDRYAMKIIF